MTFEELVRECLKRNRTIEKFEETDITISDHLDHMAALVSKNRSRGSLKDISDVTELTVSHVRKLFGDKAAEDVKSALGLKVFTTADHHGGLYSAQAFQGDLLFGELLRRMGYRGRYTPIFSFSIVELENSTYARGICVYDSPDKRVQLPIQPKKDLNRMVAVTPGFDRESVKRAKIMLIEESMGYTGKQAEELRQILERYYETPDVIGLTRYSDQITLIGERLSSGYFTDNDGRHLIYIEAEEITSQLLIRELKDDSSLIWHIFYDPQCRKAFNEVKTGDGLTLSSLLLRGVDDRGRRLHTQLQEDGSLLGAGFNGYTKEYSTDADILIRSIENRELLPNGFLDAILLFFERGITWLGGYFQSQYLNIWRDLLAEALSRAGLSESADAFAEYDGSGYISGPVYLLADATEGLCPAGPVELINHRITDSLFEERMNIRMRDAHRMGLPEIYLDLIPGNDKAEGWYRCISEYNKAEYGEYEI